MSNNTHNPSMKNSQNKKRKHKELKEIDYKNTNIANTSNISPPKKRAKICKRSSKKPNILSDSNIPNSHVTITFANLNNTIDAIILPKENVLLISDTILLSNKGKLSIKKSDIIQDEITPQISNDILSLDSVSNHTSISTIHSRNSFRIGCVLFYCSDEEGLFWAFPLRKTRRVSCQHYCCAANNKIVTRSVGIYSSKCNGKHNKNIKCIYAIANGKPPKGTINQQFMTNYQYFIHSKNIKYGIPNGRIKYVAIFWIASPFFAAIGSVLFFFSIRNLLLRRSDSYKQILRYWPLFVFVVAFIMALFLIIKGLKRLDFDYEQQLGLAFVITFSIAIGIALIAWFAFIYTGTVDKYVLKSLGLNDNDNDSLKHIQKTELATRDSQGDSEDPDQKETETNDEEKEDEETGYNKDTNIQSSIQNKIGGENGNDIENDSHKQAGMSKTQLLLQKAGHGVNVDIHDNLGELETAIRDNAEKFDKKTDKAFAWLQVCTASLGIFAHGSNDVANAVAPFAAMLGLYATGEAQKEVAVPEWVLVIGALGMVVGLSTYGYKVMKCLGVRMAPMSCSRGYSIELSSSLVVILASVYGFPTSTTHAQVGATVGIGLMELSRPDSKLKIGQVVNWKLLMQVLFGWVLTLFVAGLSCAAIFSFMAYSPYYGDVQRNN